MVKNIMRTQPDLGSLLVYTDNIVMLWLEMEAPFKDVSC
jgi:hypothetical protein